MRKAVALVFLLSLAIGALFPRPVHACESCSDDFTCLSTWSGAKECTWTERCRAVIIDGKGFEFCWTVCKQNDFSCTVNPGGDGPPRV